MHLENIRVSLLDSSPERGRCRRVEFTQRPTDPSLRHGRMVGPLDGRWWVNHAGSCEDSGTPLESLFGAVVLLVGFQIVQMKVGVQLVHRGSRHTTPSWGVWFAFASSLVGILTGTFWLGTSGAGQLSKALSASSERGKGGGRRTVGPSQASVCLNFNERPHIHQQPLSVAGVIRDQ
jgi:hypothetical protein